MVIFAHYIGFNKMKQTIRTSEIQILVGAKSNRNFHGLMEA